MYAAELNTVLASQLWPRGLVQPPLTEADQRSLALQATQNQRRLEQQVSVDFTTPAMTQREWLSSPDCRSDESKKDHGSKEDQGVHSRSGAQRRIR